MDTADQDVPVPSEAQRFAEWREVVCRTYVPVRCTRVDTRPFTARLTTQVFGTSEVSRIDSSPMSYSRGADDIRADARDEMQLCLVTHGEAHIAQDDRRACLRAGDMGLYDAALPFALEFPTDYQAVIVKLPRAVLASRLPAPERLTARLVPGDVRLGALAGSMIREAANLRAVGNESLAQRLSTSLADILALALEAELIGNQPLSSRHAQILQRVKAYVLAHLDDPLLDVARIADAHHMATRTLNRLFAADGTTAVRWLWEQRLQASHKALVEGRVRQVTEAALGCGFSDFSHFSRSFKKAYGVLPHTLLARP